nr:MAG TPA: hypothetical protein [Caudoviricetes sp.]
MNCVFLRHPNNIIATAACQYTFSSFQDTF